MLSLNKYTSHPQFSGMCPFCKSLLFSAYLKFLLLEHFLSHNVEQGSTHFICKGQRVNILGYAGREVSALWCKSRTNGHACVPITLYLQKQIDGPDLTSGLRIANFSDTEYNTFFKTCISFDPLLGIYLAIRLETA